MVRFTLILLLIMGAIHISSNAQDEINLKFGKVNINDFELVGETSLINAPAVFVADKGESTFQGNTKGGFTVVFRRYVRIKINLAAGLDAADFVIFLYHDGEQSEKLTKVSAAAYNLQNGKVEVTSMNDKMIYTDDFNKNYEVKKFTIPGAKVGSVVELTYQIESDFVHNLQPWEFQGKYPRLWSEYEVGIPDFFNYAFLAQGYQPFLINKTTTGPGKYRIARTAANRTANTETRSFRDRWNNDNSSRENTMEIESLVQYHRWVQKDVPALREIPYIWSSSNLISKIEFQLNQVRFEGQPVQNVMAQWSQVAMDLNEYERFGQDLYRNNGWLDDDLQPLLKDAPTEYEKIERIFQYVRDHYACTMHSGLYLTSNIRNVQRKRSGNVADINLLLVAMLNRAGIAAKPVILSTRENGLTHEYYPLLNRFNYVVVLATTNGGIVWLDATMPGLPVGKLPAYAYNGHARLINEEATAIYLSPDSALDKRTTLIFAEPEDKKWMASYSITPGLYDAISDIDVMKRNGLQGLIEQTRKMLPADVELIATNVPEKPGEALPLTIKYELKLPSGEDLIYFNPMIGEGFRENPFPAQARNLPVELPLTINHTHVANLTLPEGYRVEEMPKSAKITLLEGSGAFEYMIRQAGNTIELRSKLLVNQSQFKPDEYEALREFFRLVVQKQAESIVLKRNESP